MNSEWATAIVMGFVAFLGLVMASGARDGMFYATGLGLFVFGVLFIFVVITRQVGNRPHGQDGHDAA